MSEDERPMFQFVGGPWEGRTLPPDAPLPRLVRVPVAQPMTLAEGSGGARIARYVQSSIRERPDLYIFDSWEPSR